MNLWSHTEMRPHPLNALPSTVLLLGQAEEAGTAGVCPVGLTSVWPEPLSTLPCPLAACSACPCVAAAQPHMPHHPHAACLPGLALTAHFISI